MPSTEPTVAIVESSADIADLLCDVLRIADFTPVSGPVLDQPYDRATLDTFLAALDPSVVVWDIGIPYVEQWRAFQDIRSSDVLQRRGVVLTTTDKEAVAALAGSGLTPTIIEKPYFPDQIVDAVRCALASR
jgi:DNA-binding NarL/FixJ family response regulator